MSERHQVAIRKQQGSPALVASFALALFLAASNSGGGEDRQTPSSHRAPSFSLRPAPTFKFPGGHNPNRKADFLADCNSPSHWAADTLYVFNSWEQPWRSSGPDVFHLRGPSQVDFDNPDLKKLWIWMESTHRDEDGTLYAWFHNEVPNLCPPRSDDIPGYPIVAKIGALKSTDNGAQWQDLGFIFEPSPRSIRCDTEDKWYAGGMGDFCVMADRKKEYLYFFFTNYPPAFPEQGVCLARMRYADRDHPRGKVRVCHQGRWNEPALAGHATPIFPATVDITRKDGKTFWGPSIHWNTYLNRYVMVLNRVQDTAWSTEGLYLTVNRDLGDPDGWTTPRKLMDRQEAVHADPEKPGNGWYVQVMGTAKGETDKLAGQVARLFVDRRSRWEIVFSK